MARRKKMNKWHDMTDFQYIIFGKYKKPGEDTEKFLDRISKGKPELREIFENKEAIWGGRNLFAIGRSGNITGSNCYVARDPEDNLEDIYRADYEIARTYSYGGGQGLNLSKLRPKGARVNNSSNTSPGPMVFADKYSHTTLNTQQESRRGALMLVMNIDHPDIIEFATAKLDLSKINGANISVAMTDDFFEAYLADGDWVMTFENDYERIRKTVKAKDLMELIAYSNHTMGDPGMLFIDNVNNYHLLSEYDEVKFTATNPCGEQPLMANGSCNLASVNLFGFVKKPFTNEAYFDMPRFSDVVEKMIWELDELLDDLGDRHALKEQRDHVKEWREVGLGVMGLADLALGMSMAYGSDKFIELLDHIMKTMINTAVTSSALKALALGSYPKYDYDKISASSFFKTLLPSTQELVKKYGLRNSRLLSIAPTGSISNLLGVSGGVEPFYNLGYWREIRLDTDPEKVFVWERTPRELAKHLGVESVDDLPAWALVTSQNVDIHRRLKVQATLQKYVDTAISSTFNLPNEATIQDIIDIYVNAWKLGLKGATVFRDNCAKIGILSGAEGWGSDENPATPPKFEVIEDWLTKKTLINAQRQFVKTIEIGLGGNTTEHKKDIELCPECGAPLVKRSGCTKCSNDECHFEKCAI